MRIIIDGYNLLHKFVSLFPLSNGDSRDLLINDLVRYKRKKGGDITLVFDGGDRGGVAGSIYKDKGINVVFTNGGRSADEEIVEMVSLKGGGVIVVSSDRAVRERVEGFGAVCVSSEVFAQKLSENAMLEVKGTEDTDAIYIKKPKKGPSKRKNKKERRRDRVLPKL